MHAFLKAFAANANSLKMLQVSIILQNTELCVSSCSLSHKIRNRSLAEALWCGSKPQRIFTRLSMMLSHDYLFAMQCLDDRLGLLESQTNGLVRHFAKKYPAFTHSRRITHKRPDLYTTYNLAV